MTYRRLLGILVALGLTAVLGALTPSPAHTGQTKVGQTKVGPTKAAQTQKVRFTSLPPSGKDWLTSSHWYFPEYIARARASSGLRVKYSIAPASADVCAIDKIYRHDPAWGSGADISLLHAGTCTVRADQPGNAHYRPARRVRQTFQIEKVQTWIADVEATKGTPGETPATFSAALSALWFTSSHSVGAEPFLGEVITFSVDGMPVCSAITAARGVATCQAVLPPSDTFTGQFTATYAGTADYEAVSATELFVD